MIDGEGSDGMSRSGLSLGVGRKGRGAAGVVVVRAATIIVVSLVVARSVCDSGDGGGG